MDPLLTDDGRPYAPVRFKEIVRERYEISKRLHTSYNEVGEMTPTERSYILDFILEDSKRQEEMIEQAKQKAKSK